MGCPGYWHVLAEYYAGRKIPGFRQLPCGLKKYAEHTKNFSQLHIPSSEQIYLSIVLGYGSEIPEVAKRTSDNAIYIDWMKTC